MSYTFHGPGANAVNGTINKASNVGSKVWNAPIPKAPQVSAPTWMGPAGTTAATWTNKGYVDPHNKLAQPIYRGTVASAAIPAASAVAFEPTVQATILGGIGADATTGAIKSIKDSINSWSGGPDTSGDGQPDGPGGSPTPTPAPTPYDDLVGRIKASTYNAAFDNSGNPVSENYRVHNPGYTDGVQKGYAGMVDEGNRKGLSNWGQAAYDRSRADQTYAVDDARGQAMGDAAGNMNILAMQGGLESGAAENMLRQGQRMGNQARTDLYRQGSMDRMGIDVSDAARKDEMRTKGLAGQMDTARFGADVDNINVSNAISDRDKGNLFAQNKLRDEGAIIGSKAVSDAMLAQAAAAGKGGLGGMFDEWGNKLKNLWGQAGNFIDDL